MTKIASLHKPSDSSQHVSFMWDEGFGYVMISYRMDIEGFYPTFVLKTSNGTGIEFQNDKQQTWSSIDAQAAWEYLVNELGWIRLLV